MSIRVDIASNPTFSLMAELRSHILQKQTLRYFYWGFGEFCRQTWFLDCGSIQVGLRFTGWGTSPSVWGRRTCRAAAERCGRKESALNSSGRGALIRRYLTEGFWGEGVHKRPGTGARGLLFGARVFDR